MGKKVQNKLRINFLVIGVYEDEARKYEAESPVGMFGQIYPAFNKREVVKLLGQIERLTTYVVDISDNEIVPSEEFLKEAEE